MSRQPVRALFVTDQGRVSGVAISVLGTSQVRSGIYQGTKSMESAVRHAVGLAGGPEHLFWVYEDHSKIPASKAGNTATILGMGDSRGAWRVLLELAGVPQVNRASVTMDDYREKQRKTVRGWRSVVLGGGRMDREAWKRRAIEWARMRYRGIELAADAAEAACILEWALLTRPWEAPP